MSPVERIFHTILFESLALISSTVGLIIFTDHAPQSLSGTMIAVVTIAMIWNFVFNAMFDKCYPGKREERCLKMRVAFIIAFEAGLLLFTVPLMAYLLDITIIEAFWLDISVTIFITLYAFTFHYCYDNLRAMIIQRRQVVAA